MIYGPVLFSLIERVGSDALVAANGVVAGDTFGNGHFLTSGGAMTGMIGHSARVLEYWQARDAGVSAADAIRPLAESIKEDTHAWLQVSAKEYSQAVPINFGAERIEQINRASGNDASARANAIDAARRHRHALLPLDPSNWRRLFVRNGKVLSALPELETDHPLQRPEHAASLLAVMKTFPARPGQATTPPGIDEVLEEDEQTLIKPRPGQVRTAPDADKELVEGEQTMIRPRLSIGLVMPERAKVYAFLDVQQGEQEVQRIELKETQVLVGRGNSRRGTTPVIDLHPFDPLRSVSREHARIRLEPSGCLLEDLKSRNKTRVGEAPLPPFQPKALQNGDVIRFGSVKATFRLLGTSELPAPFSPS